MAEAQGGCPVILAYVVEGGCPVTLVYVAEGDCPVTLAYVAEGGCPALAHMWLRVAVLHWYICG